MEQSLKPDVKFILHGKFKHTTEEMKNWRPISVAATLKDFLRRKELNRKVSVETIHCNSRDGLDVLVLPGKVRYKNMVPENVPTMVARHIERLNEDSPSAELLDHDG